MVLEVEAEVEVEVGTTALVVSGLGDLNRRIGSSGTGWTVSAENTRECVSFHSPTIRCVNPRHKWSQLDGNSIALCRWCGVQITNRGVVTNKHLHGGSTTVKGRVVRSSCFSCNRFSSARDVDNVSYSSPVVEDGLEVAKRGVNNLRPEQHGLGSGSYGWRL